MRPSELNQLKAAVTMPSIDERAAYAHYHEHRKHIASFCGTGNNAQFLSDPTGNRRWLPFEVESIESPRDHPFDYEAIYAQAYALYQEGFQRVKYNGMRGYVVVCRSGDEIHAVQQSMVMQAEKESGSVDSSGQYF